MKKVIIAVEVEDEVLDEGFYMGKQDAIDKGVCGKAFLAKSPLGVYSSVISYNNEGFQYVINLPISTEVLECVAEADKVQVPEYIIELMDHIQKCTDKSVESIKARIKLDCEYVSNSVIEELSALNDVIKRTPSGNGISENTLLEALNIVTKVGHNE